MSFKKFVIKNCTCYYFDEMIKYKDFDVDNILTNEKSLENILINIIWNKNLIGPKPLLTRFDKKDGFFYKLWWN